MYDLSTSPWLPFDSLIPEIHCQPVNHDTCRYPSLSLSLSLSFSLPLSFSLSLFLFLSLSFYLSLCLSLPLSLSLSLSLSLTVSPLYISVQLCSLLDLYGLITWIHLVAQRQYQICHHLSLVSDSQYWVVLELLVPLYALVLNT